MVDLSKLNIGGLRNELARVNQCIPDRLDEMDFALAEAVIVGLRAKGRPMPQYMVPLSEKSEAGQAFRKKYFLKRAEHPNLPKLIGWRGNEAETYVPTRQRVFGPAPSMVGKRDNEPLMTMDPRPDEVEHDL